MLNKIIRFSIRNKLIIGLLVTGLIGAGVYNVTKLPIDAVPDITDNQVQVITISPSLAAPEVERLITFPIEQATANVPGIKEIRSFSRFGLSLVTLVFNDNTDVYWARQQVSERLQQVRTEIPADAGNPSLGPVTTGLGEIFQYAVKPKKGFENKYSVEELRTIQDWIIRRQLLGTPGVADVSSFGGKLKQYEVAINSARLKSFDLSVQDIFKALQQNNQNTGGAYIEKGPVVLYIRTEGLAKNMDDIRNIYIKTSSSGVPVYIKDVADVKIGNAVRYGAMCFNDEGEVAGAVVMMLKGGNSSEVIKNVKDRIAGIQKMLPEGVMIEPFLDRTKMVNNAISTVQKNLIEGALIVVFILVLFLGNFRAGLIVASVIPLSMLFAIILMNLFHVSGNLMSLGALDFGLIVDGAVIIVEAVMHRLYHSRQFATQNIISGEEMDKEVQTASGKMMGSAVFGQVIILIVYLPILALVGIEGKMFRPMAQTVSFALLGAFILSVTYVPMITSFFLSRKMRHKETFSDKMMNKIQAAYAPALRRALNFPKLLTGIVLIVLMFSLLILNSLGGEFIPKLEEGDFAVDTRLLTGSSLTETISSTQKAAGLLKDKFPEVEKIVTKIGSGEIPTDPMPIEASDMMVILKDKSKWTSAKTFDELANKMSKELENLPGISAGFQYPVQMRFNELMTGARQDVVCKIFGEDLDSLTKWSEKLGALVNEVDGAEDLYVEKITGLPQIVINFNRDALSVYRVNIDDVNRIIRTAFAGESAGMIYENERRFDLVVRLDETSRKDLSDVQNLLVTTGMGTQVPLYTIADISIKEGPNQIQREDAKRRIVVGFNVRGRDVQSVVHELQSKVEANFKLPVGYYITYGGQFENLVQAKQRLSIALPISLLLIFVMLYFAFGKLKYGALIFSAIPLSAIGGILALWIRGMPFSISAGVGFIALFGVAVLNGIVLISEFNRLKEQDMHDLQFIIMEGTKVRLRPVLMTAAVASLGFLPMALSNGAGAEVQRPLATVVIGGLISATFLTLVMLPVLYMWMEKPKKKKNKVRPAALLLPFILVAFAGEAQQTEERRMTLDQMLQTAKKNNLSINASVKESEYWKQMQRSVYEIPKTQITGEFGKLNSMNNDSRFVISQSFALPLVYKRQRDYYSSMESFQRAVTAYKWKDIEKQIKFEYWQIADLESRQKLLKFLDTVYERQINASRLRLKEGEADLLELSSIETSSALVKNQLSQLYADIHISAEKIRFLLNSEVPIFSLDDSIPFSPDGVTKLQTSDHPLLQIQSKQLDILRSQTMLERNKLLPDFSLGYSNMSLVGYQTRDGISQQYFNGSRRFGAVNISIGIPIFGKAVRNKIQSGKINEAASSINLDYLGKELESRLRELMIEKNKLQQSLNRYKAAGLLQAKVILDHAKQKIEKGEINYIEWTVLVNNAVLLQLDYFNLIRDLKKVEIEIDYLTAN